MADFTKKFDVSSPAGSDLISSGDDNIRDFKTALGERIGLEHQPFLNALGDMTSASAQGRHKPGYTSAVYIGTTAQINALTGMTSGCLAFDTDLNVLKIYGTDWTTRVVGTGNHAFAMRKTTGTMVATIPTKVTFDIEDFDYGSGADLVNSKYVVPITGVYLFQFAATALATTYKTQVALYKNNASLGTSASAYGMAFTTESSNSSMANGSALLSLTAGDYIELFWLHENGGTKTVYATLSGFKVF